MPVLDWIGKKAVVNHHREVPYRLIHCDGGLSSGDPDAGNLLVQGDNLEALKALLPYYAGKVKCIYIDPPYNTGSEGWIYNDNVASPEIKAWLGKVVGKESEDLSRHDKWLCMMYPRLRLLRDFRPEDGVILISIDDNALHLLRILMDEIFGQDNLLGTLVWEKSRKNDSKFISVGHEYVLFFAKNKRLLREKGTKWREVSPGMAAIAVKYRELRDKFGNGYEKIQEDLRAYYAELPPDHPSKKYTRYNKVDSGGIWRDDNMSWPGGGGPTYDVTHPKTGLPCKVPPGGWRYSTSTKMQEMISRGIVEFREDHTEPPIRKTYLVRNDLEKLEGEDDGSKVMTSYLFRSALQASSTIESIFGKKVFEHTKDHEILARLIDYVSGPNDIILDSFAGSASTGHAVLYSNKVSGSSRNFILIEMEDEICREISAKRLKLVIQGYKLNGKSEQVLFEVTVKKADLNNAPTLLEEAEAIAEKHSGEFDRTTVRFRDGVLSVIGTVAKKSAVPGLGGGFRFCRLGTPLFSEFGDIDNSVKFSDLAAHVFFSETGSPLPKKVDGTTSLIGTHKDKSIYLLYSPAEQGFAREAAGNVLTPDSLIALPTPSSDFAGTRTVYAEGCTVSAERLKTEGVIFKQIPYQIEGA